MTNDKKVLKNLRADIQRERMSVGIKPHSQNIITLALMRIAKEFGIKEANQAIIDFGLEKLGWSRETEKTNEKL